MTTPNPDVQRLIESLESAADSSEKLTERVDALQETSHVEAEEIRSSARRRARRQWAAIGLLLVLVGLMAWGGWRLHKNNDANRQILSQQNTINRQQDCINALNDARTRDTLTFLIAEYQKVNNQAIGYEGIRKALLANDPKALFGAFDVVINATDTYRDSKAITGRLQRYGVTIQHHPDGTVTLIPPAKIKVAASCSTTK